MNAVEPRALELPADAPPRPGPPLWLLAELTYRCPLHCAFCYNPVDFAKHDDELSTAEWKRVLRDARALGSVQCGFSGGEPLAREDLEELVAEARSLGYYTNLLTSGVGLTPARIQALKEAGLDHLQLSFQDSTKEVNDFLSSTKTFDLKRRVATMVRDAGIPMVMNCVVHRLNIDHVDAIIELAVEIGARDLEFANVQFYSWAQVNREQLLPSRAQIAKAEAAVARWRERLGDRMRIFFVTPDYHADRPKCCMNRWGSVFLTITPDGTALPCHTARMLPGLSFPNVRDVEMERIWHGDTGFNRFRGTGWMKEPCSTCEERHKDHGGCRCQAYMITGDIDAADPVCTKSPHRHLVDAAVAQAERTVAAGAAGQAVLKPLVFRSPQASRELDRPF